MVTNLSGASMQILNFGSHGSQKESPAESQQLMSALKPLFPVNDRSSILMVTLAVARQT